MPPCCSCFVPTLCLPVYHQLQSSSLPLRVIRVLSSLSSGTVPYSVSGVSFPLILSGFLLQMSGATKSSPCAFSTFSPIHFPLTIPSHFNTNSFPLSLWKSPPASTHSSFCLTFQLASRRVSLVSSFRWRILRATASFWRIRKHLSLLGSARTEMGR